MSMMKDKAKDELNLCRAKLFKAKKQDKTNDLDKIIANDSIIDEADSYYIEEKDDLDLERPVNVKAFENIREKRNELKEKNL